MPDTDKSREAEAEARAIVEKERLSIALFSELWARLAELGLDAGRRGYVFDLVPRTVAAQDWLRDLRKGETHPPVDAVIAELEAMPDTELLFAVREEPEDKPDPLIGTSLAERMNEGRKRAA